MKAKPFFKKRKKHKTYSQRIGERIIFPAYMAFILIGAAVIFTIMAIVDNMTVFIVSAIIYAALFFAVSFAIIFCVVPLTHRLQAKHDLKNYDFSPYTPADREKFYCRIPLFRYYFTPSPFDENESVTLHGKQAEDEYFKQFMIRSENYIGVEQLGENGEFVPFFLVNSDENSEIFIAEKEIVNEQLTVTEYVLFELTFTMDGVLANGLTFEYDKISARTDWCADGTGAEVRVFVKLSEEITASFAIGGRIAAIIEKYAIAVENREYFDYIMSNPEKAFRQLALKGKLKIYE